MAELNNENQLQPQVNKDVDITSVSYEKVDQPGAKSLLKQAQGFWVNFISMF